jgi:hypothetical protein
MTSRHRSRHRSVYPQAAPAEQRDVATDALSVWQTTLVNKLQWDPLATDDAVLELSPFPWLSAPPSRREWNQITALRFKPPSGPALHNDATAFLRAYAKWLSQIDKRVVYIDEPLRFKKKAVRQRLDVRFTLESPQSVMLRADEAYMDSVVQKIVGRVVCSNLEGRSQEEVLWIAHRSLREDKLVVELYHPIVRDWWKSTTAQALQKQLLPLFQEWFEGRAEVGFFAASAVPKGLAQQYPFFKFLLSTRTTSIALWNLFLACDRMWKPYPLDDAVRLLVDWETLDEDIQAEFYRDFSLCYLSFIAFSRQR